MQKPTNRPSLHPHPEGQDWPSKAWPIASLPDDVDSARFLELTETGFGRGSNQDLSLNLALAVAHRGQLVSEHYGRSADEDTALVSWSTAKSITHAIIGMLVKDGLIDLDAPAPVPEWADDERAAITMQQLLEMSSGLEFVEDYVDDQISHVIEMLFGEGEKDVAAYARSMPLIHKPGTVNSYSSGTTNILAAICGQIIGGGEAGMRAFMSECLFGPLGMESADPRFDKAGTLIGSSYVYATARDFLRFGYLYLRDGVWEDTRLLPEGWVDHARQPTEPEVDDTYWYGAHWWLLDNDLGAFSAIGYEGQYIIVVPDRDLVMVRLGKTPNERSEIVMGWLKDMIRCFPVITD